jgi:hypothetical protein
VKPLISRGRRWLIPVLAALLLGLGFVGVALSGDRSGSSRGQAGASDNDRVRFLDYLADELDVSKQTLLGAAQRAAERTLDDLVAEGKLTEEQAGIIRDRLTRLAADPESLRGMMKSLHRDAEPYARLFHQVRDAVEEAVGRELNADSRELRALVRRGRLDDRARRAGATPSELRAAVREAAQPLLRRAEAEGSITRLQARLALHKALAVVGHLATP